MKGSMVFILTVFFVPLCLVAQRETPNVVIILADDLGWADIGCYGNSVIETPNIDRLARQGMRFTSAYSPAPICSASRAALLTGKSPARLQFEFVTKPDNSDVPQNSPLRQPKYPRDLPLEEVTIAELLGDRYARGFFGKWHLTQENTSYLGWGNRFGPLQQGFDFGDENRGSHPYTFSKEEKKTFGSVGHGEYPVDALTAGAIDFLVENKSRPFLLYYSMYYVHTPVQTRARWLYKKYRKKMDDGADEKLVQYAAFVETMDAYVGQLLQAIEDYGLADNTVVFFISDNGGHPSYTDNGPLHGSKWTLYEGGIRTPMIAKWPGRIEKGAECHEPVSGVDLFPTIAALASAEVPFADNLDGENMLPLITTGNPPVKERVLYWHFPFYHELFVGTKPVSAIRQGRYKLLYWYENQRTELYDLSIDAAEQHDLSTKMPGKSGELKQLLLKQLGKVGARFPQPDTTR